MANSKDVMLIHLKTLFGSNLSILPRPEQTDKLTKVQKLGFFKKTKGLPPNYEIARYNISGDEDVGKIVWTITHKKKLFCTVMYSWHCMDTTDVYWTFS
jgi:hypothetical protein